MRDRRYDGRRTPSPHPSPPTRGRGRDYREDNWRLPTSSYRAPPPGSQWAERDPLPPPPTAVSRPPASFVSRRESEYHSGRNRNRSPPRSRSRSPRWQQPQRIPSQYGRADYSVSRRREYDGDRVYSDERYVRRENKLPSIGESLPRRELSGKFQWDNLPDRSTNLSPAAYRDVVGGSNPFNTRVSDSAERFVRERPRTHYDYSIKPQVRDGRFADWGSSDKIPREGQPLVGNGGYIRPRPHLARGDDDKVEDGLSYRTRTQLEQYGREHINGGRSALERNGLILRGDEELRRLQSPYDGIRKPVYLQEDVGIHDPLETLRRSRSMELEGDTHESLLRNWDPLDDDDLGTGDRDSGYEDMDDEELLMPEDLEELRHGKEGYNPLVVSPHFQPTGQMHPSKRFKASKGNIVNRLGPVAAQSVKQRLGPRLVPPGRSSKQGSSHVKQRLGPAFQPGKKNSGDDRNAAKVPPWLKARDKGQQQRVSNETASSAKGSKSLAVKEKDTKKTEPQEDSEEFIQLVNTAFFKLTKSLNENSAIRRKYTEQDGAGGLRCSVCGSDSKDFTDTLSLAQHACTSTKAGFRAEHLGFHKALCLLMGWKWDIRDVVKGPWVRQKLSDDEASSLNDDLILWPPVVVIHNSSISSENHNERIIVRIEDLRSALKGKGFQDSINNICRGKAANHSVMVVSFAATFSGLQEAEKLHRLYSDNKHGRSEFQQIGTTTNGGDDGDKRTVVEEGEHNEEAAEAVLYGFLGIASDLDKLDFEMKKRCVVKSKKEIDAIADATLERVDKG